MTFKFKYDWFSGNIPTFEKCLGEFRDQPVSGIEIGTHEGRSATWLLQNVLTHPDSSLVCIDILEQDVLEENLRATGAREKAKILIKPSHEAILSLNGSRFDFAYIDGSHWSCDVLEDAILTFRRVKVNGVIGFDDYLWDDPNFNMHGTPKPAIDSFLSCYSHKLSILEKGYQVWVRKVSE